MKKRRRTNGKFQFTRMQVVIVLFLALAALLTLVQKNVAYRASERRVQLVSDQTVYDSKAQWTEQAPDCLILWQEDAMGEAGRNMMVSVLSQMKIPYEEKNADLFRQEELLKYETVALCVTDYGLLGEGVLDLMNWVKQGGSLLVVYPPAVNGSFQLIQQSLGIRDFSYDMVMVEALHCPRAYMLGIEETDFKVTDPYDSSLAVVLENECQVYMESVSDNPVPVVWRYALGNGTVVVNNLGYLEKGYRGFYCAAYSLLGEVCAYPVINASTFYIDDFPSPIPGGESSYIKSDYGMDIKTFYTQVWWKDVYNLAQKYDIRYTGLVIEEYSDRVEAPFERNADMTRYQYFGNMLLNQGGEIGFHGFNHMPLCLENFDYLDLYDSYQQWKSYEDMKAGLKELNDFCSELFPDEEFQVYVPPSNILSQEGREMLSRDFPQIKAIASVYLPGELAYEQEFQVSEDGMVETPRIISGYILDDYTRMIAMAELNFHFVNTHFQHPDDVLDEDRGAALGWSEMFGRISDYTEWLYTSAPDIRNLTGTELAGAVQRYDMLQVERVLTKNCLTLKLNGFVDEAWLLVRLNGREPGTVKGGSLTEVMEGLYLLEAQSSQVEIEIR